MKQNLKSFKVPAGFRGRSALVVQIWWLVDCLFFRPSPQVLYFWRRMLLRMFGARIGKGVLIRPSVKVTYPWKITIGEYSWIGDEVVLYSLGEIKIGSHAVVSQRSYLCAGSHDYNSEEFTIFSLPVVVEDQAWLATDVFVGPGVTIGKAAVVGARSSVFKSIEGGKIYAGNPAKIIKER
jgi:putative colanic acid biosynthesis acetyltransferase WcaF